MSKTRMAAKPSASREEIRTLDKKNMVVLKLLD
jgi:hypothetical protein